MGPAVWVQAGNVEIGNLVYKAAILAAQRQVSRKSVVDTGAIKECAPGLRLCADQTRASIVSRIKNQNAAAAQHKRLYTGNLRQLYDRCASNLMHIGLNARGGKSGCVDLRVP